MSSDDSDAAPSGKGRNLSEDWRGPWYTATCEVIEARSPTRRLRELSGTRVYAATPSAPSQSRWSVVIDLLDDSLETALVVAVSTYASAVRVLSEGDILLYTESIASYSFRLRI